MPKPTITIHDLKTDQVITREMTAEEAAQYEIDIQEIETQKTIIAEREAARNALLNRLGITAEEAALLLG